MSLPTGTELGSDSSPRLVGGGFAGCHHLHWPLDSDFLQLRVNAQQYGLFPGFPEAPGQSLCSDALCREPVTHLGPLSEPEGFWFASPHSNAQQCPPQGVCESLAGLCILLLTPSKAVFLPEGHASALCYPFPTELDSNFMRGTPRVLLSLHPDFQIKWEAGSLGLGWLYQGISAREIANHSRAAVILLLIFWAVACMLTSFFPGKCSLQKSRRRVAGAAGAPGLLAQQGLRKEGESAIILPPRMEASHVQGGMCRPKLAEGLWAQGGTHAIDVTTCTDRWIVTSHSWE